MAALLAVSAGLRLFYLLGLERVIDTADAIHYIGAAENFAGGLWAQVDPQIPILYPLLTALMTIASPDYELAGSLVSFFGSVLLVMPVYLISRRMHGETSARIAGLAVALWPWLADYGSRVGPDALACTLWFAGVYLLAEGIRRGGWRIYAAAAALFALHLTRPEGTVLLVAAIPAAVVLSWDERRRLIRLVPFMAVSVVLMGVYTFYVKSATGAATANYRAHLILRDLDLVEYAETALKMLCEKIPIMLGPVLLLFLGAGLFYGAREISGRDRRLEYYVLFLVLVQWLASMTVLSAEPRYAMSVIVALSLWSARGIVVVGEQASQVRLGRWLRHVPVAGLVCLMLVGTATTVVAAHMDRRQIEPSEYKAAGKWMKDNLQPGLVFCRKPQVGFYAGMPSTGPDFSDTLEEAVVRARNAGARYFVVDERYTVPMVPSLAPLLDAAKAPKDLKFVKDFPQYPHSRILIYELAEQAAE